MAITGGGSGAIADLLTVPGASGTVLDAVVPYSPAALDAWLGHPPDTYCSRRTSQAMSSRAWWHSRNLASHSGDSPDDCIGVGCTASLASDRPKKGSHRCWISIESAYQSRTVHLALKKGRRSRPEEERLVADLVVYTIAESCGVDVPVLLALKDEETVLIDLERLPTEIANVRTGVTSHVWSLPGGRLSDQPEATPAGLVSGAFNPLHSGHQGLQSAASQILQGSVYFELSVVNADKPPLDCFSIEERRRQFHETPVVLTSAPRFLEKARLFPGITFVIGFDTAERILDPRFYGDSESSMHQALESIGSLGCRFLVAGRHVNGRFQQLCDLSLPARLCDLFSEIPAEQFREDISSTQLRQSGAEQPSWRNTAPVMERHVRD